MHADIKNKNRIRRSSVAALQAAFAFVAMIFAQHASALPSFAQQTGQPCSTCHVGAFGPQLTPFGREFKLGGYTLAAPDTNSIPLAAMLVTSYTQTSKDQPDKAGPHDGRNDNFSMQEASLFLAGRMTDHIGVFAQTTYSDIDGLLTLDNVDARYAYQTKIADRPAILGISVNNNPTISDVWNTLSGWRFPYMASELVPEVAAAPLIEGGLEHSVIGVSGYAFYNNNWYAELGGYASLSHSFLSKINADDPGSISGIAPYWRVAYSQDTQGTFLVGGRVRSQRERPSGSRRRTERQVRRHRRRRLAAALRHGTARGHGQCAPTCTSIRTATRRLPLADRKTAPVHSIRRSSMPRITTTTTTA